MRKIKYCFTFLFILLFVSSGFTQTFISKGKIEYEVRTDVQKTMGNRGWQELIKEKVPRFKTGYYTLSFDSARSIYQFDRWGTPKAPEFLTRGEDENKYFFDFASGTYSAQKSISGSIINISDSIPHLNWKLENENRLIAGFNCRKAYAVLFDSVYVFAFYTEEILIPGGPASFQGLPGTILGITVPRLYTSWIATKVIVDQGKPSPIKPLSSKRAMSRMEVADVIQKRLADWYSVDDPEWNQEIQEQKARFYWEAML